MGVVLRVPLQLFVFAVVEHFWCVAAVVEFFFIEDGVRPVSEFAGLAVR